MGVIKNTKKIETVTDKNELINVIPDAIHDGVMYEIKDTKNVYKTKQIQGEMNAARKAGMDYKIVTGKDTHVSSKIPQEIIIRKEILSQ